MYTFVAMHLLNFSIVMYDAVICFFVCGLSGEGVGPRELEAPPSAPGSPCGMSSSI